MKRLIGLFMLLGSMVLAGCKDAQPSKWRGVDVDREQPPKEHP